MISPNLCNNSPPINEMTASGGVNCNREGRLTCTVVSKC